MGGICNSPIFLCIVHKKQTSTHPISTWDLNTRSSEIYEFATCCICNGLIVRLMEGSNYRDQIHRGCENTIHTLLKLVMMRVIPEKSIITISWRGISNVELNFLPRLANYSVMRNKMTNTERSILYKLRSTEHSVDQLYLYMYTMIQSALTVKSITTHPGYAKLVEHCRDNIYCIYIFLQQQTLLPDLLCKMVLDFVPMYRFFDVVHD